jgi:hypothetical protein
VAIQQDAVEESEKSLGVLFYSEVGLPIRKEKISKAMPIDNGRSASVQRYAGRCYLQAYAEEIFSASSHPRKPPDAGSKKTENANFRIFSFFQVLSDRRRKTTIRFFTALLGRPDVSSAHIPDISYETATHT